MISPTVQLTRTEEDFGQHIARTVASDPEAGWIFVMDNLTTHVSETLVRYVAKTCAITDELGVKGKKGILKSVATRRALFDGCRASDPVRLCAEAYVVAESDRDLVQHFGETGTQAR